MAGADLRPIVLSGWLRAVPEDVELAFAKTRGRHVNLSVYPEQARKLMTLTP